MNNNIVSYIKYAFRLGNELNIHNYDVFKTWMIWRNDVKEHLNVCKT